MGWAMAVHTRPRNDGVLVNESTGETRDNAGWTEQRGLKGKLGSLRAAAVAPDAWSAPQRGSSKLGLFGMLGRLGLALSAAAVVGFLVIGRVSPLRHTGGSGTATVAAELRLANGTVAERQSIPVEGPPATAGTRIVGNQPAEPNDPQTSETPADQPQTQLAAPLDLLRIEDATRVQQRLIELRLLSGPADGVWGPRSRLALRGFRVANNLGSGDKWDEQTQQELFKTSVVRESSANQPGTKDETAETPPAAARNPLNHADALWIQERLHDLGYYFSDADGVWGASSRSALRDFKTINGLQENDTWDKETEERLSSGKNIHPSNIFLGRWGLGVDQCRQSQSGSAPITINSHRAETAGSACNFRSVKREGTNSWRIHALCSADGNSWNANIRLKLIGSKLSWSSERGTETYVRCPRQIGPAMTEGQDGTRVHIGSR